MDREENIHFLTGCEINLHSLPVVAPNRKKPVRIIGYERAEGRRRACSPVGKN
jgi:hypothetical protein